MRPTTRRSPLLLLPGFVLSCAAGGPAFGDEDVLRPELSSIAVLTPEEVERIEPTPALTLVDDDDFEISVVFGSELTATQQEVFDVAAGIWDLVITGYQPGVAIPSQNGPIIDASGPEIDGVGDILGQAGPTLGYIFSGPGFFVASEGVMQFDSADLASLEASGQLLDVIFHEMGHVLGVGTLWDTAVFGTQQVSVDGTGVYTGAAGVAAYQNEFDPDATFVPVEQDGGAGTVDSHWDESPPGGQVFSNITGDPLSEEILTGYLGVSSFLSTLTVQSLVDIGYTVDPLFVSDSIANLGALFTAPPLFGDADFDGDVDGDDLITVQTNFLAVGPPPLLGDGDFDGDVDGDDLIAVQTNFLATTSDFDDPFFEGPFFAVPEPSTLGMLLALGFAGLAEDRGRRRATRSR